MKGRALPRRLREAILDDGPCAYCESPQPTQVDHVQPYSRGGSDDPENLAPACWHCNHEKLDFTPEEWRAWRLETGRPWPPPNTLEIRLQLFWAMVARLTDDVMERVLQGGGVTKSREFMECLHRFEAMAYDGQDVTVKAGIVLAGIVNAMVATYSAQ